MREFEEISSLIRLLKFIKVKISYYCMFVPASIIIFNFKGSGIRSDKELEFFNYTKLLFCLGFFYLNANIV